MDAFRRTVLLMLLSSVALGGCSDGGRSDSFLALAEDTDVEVDVTPTTAAIRGIVVDPAIRPIADARVSVDVQQTATDAAGGFGFSGLTPGEYLVKVEHPSYRAALLAVVAEAGMEPPWTRIVLEPRASDAPRIDAYHFQGMVGASVVVGVVGLPIGFVSGDAVTTAYSSKRYEVPDAFRLVQIEVAWDSTLPVFEDLSTSVSAWASNISYGWNLDWPSGPSPLVIPVDAHRFAQAGPGYYPPLEVSFSVWTGYDPSGPASASATFRQSFDAFTHVFYNSLPPQGWAFTRDGPPP